MEITRIVLERSGEKRKTSEKRGKERVETGNDLESVKWNTT